MKLYDGIVRHQGLTTNEIHKTGMTAAEVEVLRALHGQDAVVGIVPSTPANTKRTSAEERQRLTMIYADPASLTGVDGANKAKMLTELFGHPRLPLPDDLADPVADEGEETSGVSEAIEEVAAVSKPPIKRAKLAELAFAD